MYVEGVGSVGSFWCDGRVGFGNVGNVGGVEGFGGFALEVLEVLKVLEALKGSRSITWQNSDNYPHNTKHCSVLTHLHHSPSHRQIVAEEAVGAVRKLRGWNF